MRRVCVRTGSGSFAAVAVVRVQRIELAFTLPSSWGENQGLGDICIVTSDPFREFPLMYAGRPCKSCNRPKAPNGRRRRTQDFGPGAQSQSDSGGGGDGGLRRALLVGRQQAGRAARAVDLLRKRRDRSASIDSRLRMAAISSLSLQF